MNIREEETEAQRGAVSVLRVTQRAADRDGMRIPFNATDSPMKGASTPSFLQTRDLGKKVSHLRSHEDW